MIRINVRFNSYCDLSYSGVGMDLTIPAILTIVSLILGTPKLNLDTKVSIYFIDKLIYTRHDMP